MNAKVKQPLSPTSAESKPKIPQLRAFARSSINRSQLDQLLAAIQALPSDEICTTEDATEQLAKCLRREFKRGIDPSRLDGIFAKFGLVAPKRLISKSLKAHRSSSNLGTAETKPVTSDTVATALHDASQAQEIPAKSVSKSTSAAVSSGSETASTKHSVEQPATPPELGEPKVDASAVASNEAHLAVAVDAVAGVGLTAAIASSEQAPKRQSTGDAEVRLPKSKINGLRPLSGKTNAANLPSADLKTGVAASRASSPSVSDNAKAAEMKAG